MGDYLQWKAVMFETVDWPPESPDTSTHLKLMTSLKTSH